MQYKITSKFTFEAGHKLKKAYMTACSDTVHGHSYKVYVSLETDKLGENGMVIDFKRFKECIKPIIEDFDHSLIIAYDDPNIDDYKKNEKKLLIVNKLEQFDNNPTAECIGFMLRELIKIRLINEIPKEAKLRLQIYETENNCVEIGD